MDPATEDKSDKVLVADLESVSFESLIKSKLEFFLRRQKEAGVQLDGLYDIVVGQAEKAVIEVSLREQRGIKVQAAQWLGINRNTLKKKMDTYNIKAKEKKTTTETP